MDKTEALLIALLPRSHCSSASKSRCGRVLSGLRTDLILIGLKFLESINEEKILIARQKSTNI